MRALLLAGARRSVKSEGTRQTALMTAFAEGHKRVMDEFYDARSALARQRPPLQRGHRAHLVQGDTGRYREM